MSSAAEIGATWLSCESVANACEKQRGAPLSAERREAVRGEAAPSDLDAARFERLIHVELAHAQRPARELERLGLVGELGDDVVRSRHLDEAADRVGRLDGERALLARQVLDHDLQLEGSITGYKRDAGARRRTFIAVAEIGSDEGASDSGASDMVGVERGSKFGGLLHWSHFQNLLRTLK